MYDFIRNLIIATLLLMLLSACSLMRSEFYRAECRHVYDQALTAYKAGQYDKAAESFEEVIQLDPTYPQAYANLGHIALTNKKFGEAAKMYQQAIELKPELKNTLLPFLFIAMDGEARQPLVASGLDLGEVLRLLQAGEIEELNRKLNQPEIPLALLAKDYSSVEFVKLSTLERLIVEQAHGRSGSSRYQLFLAYYLSYAHLEDNLAISILEDISPSLESADRQEASMMLGALSERVGDRNKAVNAYLAAVEAGTAMTGVAPMLAKIYGVPVEVFLEMPKASEQVVAQTDTKSLSQTIGIPKMAEQTGSETIQDERSVSKTAPLKLSPPDEASIAAKEGQGEVIINHF